MSWRYWLVVAALAALVLILFFRGIDRAVTVDHMSQELHFQNQQAQTLAQLVTTFGLGMSREEFLSKLPGSLREQVQEKGPDELWVGNVRLSFANHRLVAVNLE